MGEMTALPERQHPAGPVASFPPRAEATPTLDASHWGERS